GKPIAFPNEQHALHLRQPNVDFHRHLGAVLGHIGSDEQDVLAIGRRFDPQRGVHRVGTPGVEGVGLAFAEPTRPERAREGQILSQQGRTGDDELTALQRRVPLSYRSPRAPAWMMSSRS
ncbi:hypothetical protein RZS08_08795, partial [Arthrospira platensis SPKY1]|nr:hypothetical protein [Arthrospira platensis SPKY1]